MSPVRGTRVNSRLLDRYLLEHEEIIQLIETSAPAVQIEDAARRHRMGTLHAYLSIEHPETSPELFDALTHTGDSR